MTYFAFINREELNMKKLVIALLTLLILLSGCATKNE